MEKNDKPSTLAAGPDLEGMRGKLIPLLYEITMGYKMDDDEYQEARRDKPWMEHWTQQADRVIALLPALPSPAAPLEALREEIEAKRGDALARAVKAQGRGEETGFREGQIDAYEQVLAILPASSISSTAPSGLEGLTGKQIQLRVNKLMSDKVEAIASPSEGKEKGPGRECWVLYRHDGVPQAVRSAAYVAEMKIDTSMRANGWEWVLMVEASGEKGTEEG